MAIYGETVHSSMNLIKPIDPTKTDIFYKIDRFYKKNLDRSYKNR